MVASHAWLAGSGVPLDGNPKKNRPREVCDIAYLFFLEDGEVVEGSADDV